MAILVKSDSARNFEDLPPTQRCIDSVYIRRGCDRKRFNSAAFIKKKGHPVTWAGGRGFTAKIVFIWIWKRHLCKESVSEKGVSPEVAPGDSGQETAATQLPQVGGEARAQCSSNAVPTERYSREDAPGFLTRIRTLEPGRGRIAHSLAREYKTQACGSHLRKGTSQFHYRISKQPHFDRRRSEHGQERMAPRTRSGKNSSGIHLLEMQGERNRRLTWFHARRTKGHPSTSPLSWISATC